MDPQNSSLIVLGLKAALTVASKVISWAGRGRICVSWLSHTSANTTFFPMTPTTFLTCLRGERRKYARNKFVSPGYRTHNQ